MIAPAITRRLKLDPEIRTTAGGGVSVTDTMSSVPNTVAHMSTRPAKRRSTGFPRGKTEIRRVRSVRRDNRKGVSDVSRRLRFIEEPRSAPKRMSSLKGVRLDAEPIRSPQHGERTFRYRRNPRRTRQIAAGRCDAVCGRASARRLSRKAKSQDARNDRHGYPRVWAAHRGATGGWI